jgi:hypothetical protein
MRPGCNLKGCYKRHYHDHNEEEEEEVGCDGQWTCVLCDLTHDHDHGHETAELGGNGWEWECDTGECGLKYKHGHRATKEAVNEEAATPVARNDHDLSGYEDESSGDEEEEDFGAGNNLGTEEMADDTETSEFHEQARWASGW